MDMQATRRFRAIAARDAVGLVPAVGRAQADASADDLMRRLRDAPGSRVGGATRGINSKFSVTRRQVKKHRLFRRKNFLLPPFSPLSHGAVIF
jgi:hypothetical protein